MSGNLTESDGRNWYLPSSEGNLIIPERSNLLFTYIYSYSFSYINDESHKDDGNHMVDYDVSYVGCCDLSYIGCYDGIHMTDYDVSYIGCYDVSNIGSYNLGHDESPFTELIEHGKCGTYLGVSN